MKCCSGFCKLFQVLCLPPCPRNIIEHAAFQPPSPTYEVQLDSKSSKYSFKITRPSLHRRLKWFYRCDIPKDIDVFYADTKYSSKILCVYYAVTPAVKTTILYSHGNASDLGTVAMVCVWLARKLNCNFLAYDYTGYGRSTGRPSEKKIYADIETAYNILLEKYNCDPKDIVLLGQSLGSAPTLELATKVSVGGVIVQSGFLSAFNVAFPREEPRQLCCDLFNNGGKIAKVTCPVLVIHGTDDDVINMSHGLNIYERSPNAVEPLWLEGAGHNDVESYVQFTERIRRFLEVELSHGHCYVDDCTEKTP
ncbi:alpha/beta hydrolase domain-containing protein 17C-like [Macrosteles quadrilineatus]|uniref:alpha/beta hydrolase domain-containing protein 17C-like n=1 Tax=Macrosteles quadrilineatus TaxID=74068 RepID=UPI0023E2F739|nr:alpha/beta hydrolase domain-containing protein 17C-like [Macrosteles quadrilineatus]